MRVWDSLTFLALIFTALVTPFEVGFVPVSDEQNAMFYVNRAVDMLFGADILLQFFLMYQEEKIGGEWVTDHKRIIKHYVQGWFVIDVAT